MSFGKTIVAGIAMLVSTGVPALAHHSFSEYDLTKTVTFTCTVVSTQWANPHSYLRAMVPDPSGHPAVWRIEYGTPDVNIRLGWRYNSLKAGDKVKMIVNPSRTTPHSAALRKVTLPDGRVLQTAFAYLTSK